MNIAIVGSGNIGGTLARLFLNAGHVVRISNRRGPDSLAALVESLGTNCSATTVEEAVATSEVAVLALPWSARAGLPASDLFKQSLVVDAMNPYIGQGKVEDLGDLSSSGMVRDQLSPQSLVKAFNTIYYRHLAENGRPKSALETRQVIFLSGDEPDAKGLVSSLIEEIGFASFDLGSSEASKRIQAPGGLFYSQILKLSDAQAMLP